MIDEEDGREITIQGTRDRRDRRSSFRRESQEVQELIARARLRISRVVARYGP